MTRAKRTAGEQKPQGPRGAGDLVGPELDARRSQRLRTVEMLRGGRTPLQVVAVAGQAAALTDDAIEEQNARHPPRPPVACREGCAWCCHKVVGTAAPEVVRIIEYLRQALPPRDFEAFRERVIARDEERRALGHDRWAAARVPCPLLVDDRCSAYPVRPLTCRGYNSQNARACELAGTSRERTVVPVHGPQHRLATFVLDGMRAGLGEVGLKGELLELTSALRVALSVPDAIQRWLAGEAAFAPAKYP
jgi:Fe-S-cluster containining protein